jgi:hypothetical protein
VLQAKTRGRESFEQRVHDLTLSAFSGGRSN